MRKCLQDTVIQACLIDDVRPVVVLDAFRHGVHVNRRRVCERPRRQILQTVAEQGSHRRHRQRRETMLRPDVVDRPRQIRAGIGDGAIQVKHQQ